MYYVMRAPAPSLHRESTDSLIISWFHVNTVSLKCYVYIESCTSFVIFIEPSISTFILQDKYTVQ